MIMYTEFSSRSVYANVNNLSVRRRSFLYLLRTGSGNPLYLSKIGIALAEKCELGGHPWGGEVIRYELRSRGLLR